MEQARYRIEVFYKAADYRSRVIAEKLNRLGCGVEQAWMTDNYLLNADITEDDAERAALSLAQAVTQSYKLNTPYNPGDFDYAVEIGYLPGVTDNVSHTVRESIEDLLKTELDVEKSVFTSVTYFFKLKDRASVKKIAEELHNPLIQRSRIMTADEYISEGGMGRRIPVVHIHERASADIVDLNISEDELAVIGKEGIADSDGSRRGPLALDRPSLIAIKDYFLEKEKRNPRDIELESIAQTWSEHCKHTIFAAEIDEVKDGIFKRYIREATVRIRREKGDRDFCLSVFTDNAGGIEFDDDYIVADKVETHNSPSALDPFGGSITGIVGVNRDAIGFGMASKPIANRYGFCFANPFDEKPLYRGKTPDTALLSPRRIMEGVIHGVNAGGNTSGIPTPQGFVYFDDRYKGKPLVFVGTIGLIPKTVNGKSSVMKRALPGDNIVIIGGRVGRDGIHGATFSSEALDSGSPATAVQIGDPITQKKLSDAVVKEARDMGLYNSVTDNGAGGISCSVAEMAKESGGFEVDLEKVPLKYPGLAPWQIWVSESQERMTLSVPDESLDKFIALMKSRGVESSVIGKFNAGTRGIVRYNGEVIFDLDMTFLHDGLPKKVLKTTLNLPEQHPSSLPEPESLKSAFTAMISRLNTASFEFISHQYDHEVQANSMIKPLQGKGRVNGNASVIAPVPGSKRAVVMSQALYPSYSEIDPYKMAACSIDTAVRNAVSVGGSVDYMALLDNFCWCDSNNPERLGQLKEAARACYEYAVAYGAPFVSGKDSMFNDFKGYDECFNPVNLSVPPTLLISSIGVITDSSVCQTLDFKAAGDIIYVIGSTGDETGGSEYELYLKGCCISADGGAGTVPAVCAASNIRTYRLYEEAMKRGLIASGISVERGGIGVALAKSAIGGMMGCNVDISAIPSENVDRPDILLFSETQGRFIVSVSPESTDEFEKIMGNTASRVGSTTSDGTLTLSRDKEELVSLKVDDLNTAYRGVFAGF